MNKRNSKEQEIVIVDNKVIVSVMVGLTIALTSWVVDNTMGVYGMIIGAFFTWVMATYAYIIYGIDMLRRPCVRVLIITPLTLYTIANIIWYVYGNPRIEEVLSQILGAISTTMITCSVLVVLLRIASHMPGAKL